MSVTESYASVTLADFHTADPPMRACLEMAHVAAQTDLPVLILGESGTGKTLMARAIHNSSIRSAAPFISFNAAALSDTLLDSQLFGHERGAFTGAVRGMKGKFELADTGTLFIDEIADMSVAGQAKILRAVECGEFERLGSETLRIANVRLISATHLPLQRYIEAEHFRKDLFYRISGITVAIPPLRDRPHDLRELVANETAAASRAQGKTIIGLDRRAASMLFAWHWPGNLRELKRVIHSAVAMNAGAVIQPEAVLLEGGPTVAPRRAVAVEEGDGRIRDASLADGPAVGMESEDLSLRTAQQRHIQRVLALMRGNKRRAARALGLSRSTLDRKLGDPRVGGFEARP